MTYNRVLVLTGDDAVATRTAELGVALADRLDATVHLLHVADERSSRLSLGAESPAAAGELTVPAPVRDLVAETDADVRTHVASGPVREQVRRHAKETDADLVVLGQDANGTRSSRWLDDLVDGVVRDNDVPVLTLPDADALENGFEQLVVPNTETVSGEAAAEHAAAVAEAHGMAVRVVTVVDLQRVAGPFNAGGVSTEFVERKERELRSPVERVLDRRPEIDGDLSFDSLTTSTGPSAELGEYVADTPGDVVVVGHDEPPALVRQFRETGAGRIRRTVDVPVLVVP